MDTTVILALNPNPGSLTGRPQDQETQSAQTETTAQTGPAVPETGLETQTVPTGAESTAETAGGTAAVPETTIPAVTEAVTVSGTTAETAVTETTESGSRGLALGIAGLILALTLALTAVLVLCRRKKNRPAAPSRTEPPVPVRRVETVDSAVLHEVGRREDQQDSWGVYPRREGPDAGVLAVVADGMGGLANGNLVSSSLNKIFADEFLRSAPEGDPADLLLRSAARANVEISRILAGSERSGSTLVSAILAGGRLYYLTAGDSRIYLYRGGGLIRLNTPHVYRETLAVRCVNQQVPLELIHTDRQKDSLVSYFGSGVVNALSRTDEGIRLVPGDRIMLASDGVFGTITEAQMESCLRLPLKQAAEAMGQAVAAAGQPYQDNYTAVLLEYCPG